MNEDLNEFLTELAAYMTATCSPTLTTSPRALFVGRSDDSVAADPFAVLASYQGGSIPVVPVWGTPIQCMARGEKQGDVMLLVGKLLNTLRDSVGSPLRMKTFTHYRINGVNNLGTPFPLPPDENTRFIAAFNFEARFVKVT